MVGLAAIMFYWIAFSASTVEVQWVMVLSLAAALIVSALVSLQASEA